MIDRVERPWEICRYSHGEFNSLHSLDYVIFELWQYRCHRMTSFVARDLLIKQALSVNVLYHLAEYLAFVHWRARLGYLWVYNHRRCSSQCIHLLCWSLLVSGEVMYSDKSLIYLGRIKSGPVAQSVLIVLIYFSFAWNVTLPRTKGHFLCDPIKS